VFEDRKGTSAVLIVCIGYNYKYTYIGLFILTKYFIVKILLN